LIVQLSRFEIALFFCHTRFRQFAHRFGDAMLGAIGVGRTVFLRTAFCLARPGAG
jgi:hypothetical protein